MKRFLLTWLVIFPVIILVVLAAGLISAWAEITDRLHGDAAP